MPLEKGVLLCVFWASRSKGGGDKNKNEDQKSILPPSHPANSQTELVLQLCQKLS